MKFDDAVQIIDGMTMISGGFGVSPDVAKRIIEDLREEYTPTIEMTKEQSEDLNSIIREVGEVFELNEIPAGVKLTDKVIELESSYILFKYLNAILHPETIKVIDNEQ